MTVTDELRARIREQAANRYGYCLTHQHYVPWPLEIEHIVPKSRGGSDDEENLWLACHSCNLFKGGQDAWSRSVNRAPRPVIQSPQPVVVTALSVG